MAEYIEKEKTARILQEEATNAYPTPYHIGLFAAARAIESIPAADVRSVVRGRWIEHYEPYSAGEEMVEAQYGYECSICGRWEYEKEPFCNCGAMMEVS